MKRQCLAVAIAVGLAWLVSSCGISQSSVRLAPDTDLARVSSFYVVRLPADIHGMDRLIRDKLIALGYSARSGNGAPPQGTDLLVTYWDKWSWDITPYMLELTIQFRNAENGSVVATGHALHTSLSRRSPEQFAAEVMENMFRQSRLRPSARQQE